MLLKIVDPDPDQGLS